MKLDTKTIFMISTLKHSKGPSIWAYAKIFVTVYLIKFSTEISNIVEIGVQSLYSITQFYRIKGGGGS